ncbi:MAG: type II toxin-antitoxin system HicA family toxin [Solirubrobacterales bacterium]|nr:type II toxin-antitoxin system HicA family toxin [Solirubrobacterales bacterium]
MNQKSAIALLSLNGSTQVTGGKHVKMTKKGMRPVTLPHHRDSQYGQALTTAILRQAGLPKEHR